MHDALINLHLVATSAMVGVIWMVQTVHYPSFLYVDRSKYKPFQEFHMSGIGFVVVPLMTVEFITGASLIFIHKISNVYFFSSILLLVGIWFLTAIVFTRIHNKLLDGYNEKLIHDLISFNWFRTVMWTTRLVLLSFL